MIKLWIPRLLLLGLGTSVLAAQSTTPPPAMPPAPRVSVVQPTGNQPTIADMARKIRQDKAMSNAPKARRVFDNDSMPHDPNARASTSETIDASKDAASQKDASADAKEADKDKTGDKTAKDAKGAKKDEKPAENEQVWRDRFAKLRGTLDTENRRLDVLQREFNLAQIQNYSDPNVALREQFARTELTKRQTEIEQQRQVVDGIKKAISDLEEEARLKGVPPAWTQPPQQ